VQAWESARQAEEVVRQGRAIMMFTIITIVFVGELFREIPTLKSRRLTSVIIAATIVHV
jgi:hypothetical protein